MANEIIAKKILVIGASENPARYSHLAVLRLREKKYRVVAIGKRKGKINDVEIETEKKNFEDVHTITLYLNPMNQKEYYEYVIGLKPQRLIFNPGAENNELYQMAKQNGIEPVEACTLVMLSIGNF